MKLQAIIIVPGYLLCLALLLYMERFASNSFYLSDLHVVGEAWDGSRSIPLLNLLTAYEFFLISFVFLMILLDVLVWITEMGRLAYRSTHTI